jgi:hypothetical protein
MDLFCFRPRWNLPDLENTTSGRPAYTGDSTWRCSRSRVARWQIPVLHRPLGALGYLEDLARRWEGNLGHQAANQHVVLGCRKGWRVFHRHRHQAPCHCQILELCYPTNDYGGSTGKISVAVRPSIVGFIRWPFATLRPGRQRKQRHNAGRELPLTARLHVDKAVWIFVEKDVLSALPTCSSSAIEFQVVAWPIPKAVLAQPAKNESRWMRYG